MRAAAKRDFDPWRRRECGTIEWVNRRASLEADGYEIGYQPGERTPPPPEKGAAVARRLRTTCATNANKRGVD